MPQETTSILTNNSASGASQGFFGSLFSGLGNLITTAAPVAANIYTLQMQGDVLKNQLASQNAAAAAAAAANKPATSASSSVKPWMIWSGVGLAVALLFVLLRRKN